MTGVCGTAGPCRVEQHLITLRMHRAARKEPPPVTAEDLDAMVDELADELLAH
jgi:hypothetical protein